MVAGEQRREMRNADAPGCSGENGRPAAEPSSIGRSKSPRPEVVHAAAATTKTAAELECCFYCNARGGKGTRPVISWGRSPREYSIVYTAAWRVY